MRSSTSARLAAVVTAVAVGLVGGVVAVSPAHAAATYVGTMKAGTTMVAGDQITSENGQFRLVMQADGNLVEYGIGNAVLWSSNTANKPGAVALYGQDGVLTLRLDRKAFKQWGTGNGVPGRDLGVQPDGIIRSKTTANKVLWSVDSYQDRVKAGNVILPGTVLRSDTSQSRTFTMQADGNLVQLVSGKPVWSSRTSRKPGARAAVQTDGSLAVIGTDGRTLWSSNSGRAGAGQLLVQLDANVVVYGKNDTRAWSTRKVTGLLWPVASTKITGRFGDDRGAGHTPRYHQGTDAAVGVGTPVYASGSGTVTSTIANDPSFGNYVVVTYGLTTVLTAHLSKIEVSKGQIVSPSTEIARSGNTGQSTGPHVHVETRVNGTLKDPLTILHFR
ncbi:peptidoglycan DD-metalloendopeptidase family protein [Curtobacterium sp. 22159]|uniref:peptidoglycan DD-metalloendopeptidase family protein n=1 Tax=Curtobacterium sp. 22159 TaxID=3453882 RepID=UPI003F857C07